MSTISAKNKEPADFWLDQAIIKPQKDDTSVVQRRRLQERVLKYLARKHPDIYLGLKFAQFTSKQGEQLLKQLRRSLSTFEYLYCIRFLIKCLEAGIEQLEWTRVELPSMPIAAAREPARFTPLAFRSLNTIQPLHTAFTTRLEQATDGDPSREFGLILLSAILYGGLLDRNWLTPLLRGIASRIRMHNSLMWIDMQRPYRYPKHAEQPDKGKYIERRWLPDPLTQALIIRLHTHHPHILPASQKLDALVSVKTVLHHMCGGENVPSIAELYNGARCYLALRVPSFLVSFATGKTSSTTLPAPVWSRLLHGKAIKIMPSSDMDEAEECNDLHQMADCPEKTVMRTQEKLRKQLITILGEARRGRTTCTPTRKKVSAFYDENASSMVPVLQMLTQWALEMLGRAEITLQGRKGKNPLQPSSIATYLSAIDQELLACSGKDTITLYDPEELRDLYDDVVKAVKGNNKKHTASFRLTQFHRFLMRTYGAPLIDMDGMVATKGPPELGVDANILSPHMFRSALFSLGWELPQRSRIQTIRCLVAILGYRCGLRRHEALALRIGDVMGEAAPEILIRTSYLNRLKTTDSARRLPLYLLLEPDEARELLHWRQVRIAEESSHQHLASPLFALPGTRQLVDDNQVFPEIHAVLRHVTGDPGLRFHHLRHSLANRLLLTLLSSQVQLDSLPEQLQELYQFHVSPRLLVQGLFGTMCQGRQFLYGISTLLGHADPSTTLLSYLHLADLLLGQMVRHPSVQPSLSAEAVMQITGLKRAMVFRTKAEKKCDDWKMEMYRERMSRHASTLFPDPYASVAHEIKPLPPQAETISKQTPDWKMMLHALKLHQMQGMPPDQIAKRFRISTAVIKTWCDGASAIRDLTTKEGTPRHLTAWQRSRENRLGIINLFPAPPDNPDDKTLVAKILKKTSALSAIQLETVRDGCRVFIEQYSSNQGYVRFTEVEAASAYKEFLQLVGVPEAMMYVSMFTKSDPPRQSELDEQKKILAFRNLMWDQPN